MFSPRFPLTFSLFFFSSRCYEDVFSFQNGCETASERQEMEAYRLYTVVPRLVNFLDDLTNWWALLL